MPEKDGSFVLRNHPSVIIKNLVRSLFAVAFVILVNIRNFIHDGQLVLELWMFLPGLILFAALAFIFWRIWALTTYTFGDTEILVKRDTVFKRNIHIQYSRLASVNVRRGIINHIFGTTELLFNVNSSVNPANAEASITLPSEEADRLRESISSRIFRRELVIEEDHRQGSLVEISNSDIILHGLFGQPTVQSIVGLGSLIYSIATLFWGDGTGIIPALVLFVLSSLYPWVRTVLRYYNYRIYRVDDTITVQSGLISNYRSSFNIKKVNSVRIRQPLLARVMGKALLEAEVVGLADSEGMPLLCPLKGKDTVMSLGEQLVPEFLFGFEHRGQPSKALVPTVLYKAILGAIVAAIGIVLFLYLGDLHYSSEIERDAALIIVGIITVAVPILFILHGILAQGNREFAMSDETFMFTIGAYDRETDFIRYDKVQKTLVSNGPIQRMFGVATCTVSLMSSAGFKSITSGVFLREELDAVPEEIMARIRDGRYDYRRYL